MLLMYGQCYHVIRMHYAKLSEMEIFVAAVVVTLFIIEYLRSGSSSYVNNSVCMYVCMYIL
jgi:hypothetical protein